jgi:hypothetical protein
MPEEYVYKIVVDDAEIQTTLNKVDQRIKTLAQQADQSFAGIGRQMSAGLQQTTEKATAAAREIAQTEQRTGQQLQQTYGQVGQAAAQSYGQRRQEAIKAAQTEVKEAEKVVASSKRKADALRDEQNAAKAALANQRAIAAQAGATRAKATAAVAKQAAVEKRARDEIKTAEQTGLQAGIDMANQRHALTAQRLEDLEREKAAAINAHEEEKAKIPAFIALEKERGRAAKIASEQASTAKNKERVASKALTTETRAAGKEQMALERRQKAGAKAFIRTTKTYNNQRNQLHALAKRYGSFNVTLGKTSGELNKQEKEVMDVIRSDKQLSAELDKLIAKYGELNVSVDRATFRGGRPGGVGGTSIQGQQLRQAGFAAQRLGIPGTAVIGEAAMVGGAAGIAVAGVLLSVKALTSALVGMGKAGVNAFISITRASMDAAKEIEIAEAQFQAFFQGDTAASEATMKRLLDLSKELGENVVGIGRAFLPEVENLDQLEEVVKAATALARFQPEQGMMGARIALQEALGGEFRSLQRRFEVTPVAIDRIRTAYEESGIEGFLQELQGELERTGRSVEDLSDTFQVSLGRIQQRIHQLKAVLGEPILEEFKDQFGAIDDELERLEPDLKVIATAFGEVISKLVEMVGVEVDRFLENFDPQPLMDVATAAFEVLDTVGLLFRILEPGKAAALGFNTATGSMASVLENLNLALLRAAKQLNEWRDDFVSTALDVAKVLKFLNSVVNFTFPTTIGIATIPVEGVLGELIENLEEMEDMEPFDWDAEILAQQKRIEAFNDGLEDLMDSLSGSSDAGEDAANAFTTYTQAMEDAEAASKNFAEAQEKVNEALNEFQIAADIKFEKLLTNIARQSLDDEIDAQRKLIDIETKNLQKIKEIREKNTDAIADAGQELGDREADIARKNSRAMLDLEEDLNEKRLEVEKDYLEELERLRDKFNFDAFEAILANDAKRLRQIRRRQAFEEKQLQKDRDSNKDDVEEEAENRRQELQKQLERELEDARIVNARKIRDLSQTLERQLEKQEQARLEDIANANLAEQRKRNDLETSLNRQLEDYRKWWDERNRVTQEKVSKDIEEANRWAQAWQEAMDKINTIRLTPTIGGMPLPPGVTDIPAAPPAGQAQEDIQARVIELMQTQLQAQGLGPGSREFERVPEWAMSLDIPSLVAALDNLQQAVLGASADVIGGDVDVSPAIQAIQARVLELSQMIQTSAGMEPLTGETLALEEQRITGLDIPTLVSELERMQDVLSTMAIPPSEYDKFIPTEDLADQLTSAQAVFLSSLGDTLATAEGQEVIPIEGLVDLLTQAQTAAPDVSVELPEEAVAPLIPGNVPTQAGQALPADEDEPTPVTIVDSTGQPTLPIPGITEPEPEMEPDLSSLIPANIVPPREGFAGVGGAGVAEGIEEASPLPVVPVTPAGLALATVSGDGEALPATAATGAGGYLQVSDPSAGFDPGAFMDSLEEMVEAEAAAQLDMRGEIEDTEAHAALLAEARAIGTSAALSDEVDAYQRASDQEIAILEATLASHQAALAGIASDPALAADAAVLESSIGVLQDTLTRLREQAQQEAAGLLDDEIAAVESAEEEKVGAVDRRQPGVGYQNWLVAGNGRYRDCQANRNRTGKGRSGRPRWCSWRHSG